MTVVRETMIGHDGRFCVLTHGNLAGNWMHYTWDEQIAWCQETFGPSREVWECQRTNPITSSFRFKRKEDRTLFILRWA